MQTDSTKIRQNRQIFAVLILLHQKKRLKTHDYDLSSYNEQHKNMNNLFETSTTISF